MKNSQNDQQYNTRYNSQYDPQYAAPPKKKGAMIAVILFLIGLLIATLAVLYFAGGNDAEDSPKTRGNSAQQTVRPTQEATEATAEPAPSGSSEIQSEPAALPEELMRIFAAAGVSEGDVKGTQLISVESSGSSGVLRIWEKDGTGTWHEAGGQMSCFVGQNGVTAHKTEGDRCTPTGLYPLGHAFGVAAAPRTGLEYRAVSENSYWVDDPGSEYYNRWVEADGSITWKSAEHLIEYPGLYAYAVVVEYNTDPVVNGAGSAIFLHCGSGATLGCVATDTANMLAILSWLSSDAAPSILIF